MFIGRNVEISLIFIPMWWVLMFLATWFTRNTLTQFFVMQMEAEKTRDSLTQILDNLPDAVLMLESGHLSYCNQIVDILFDVNLS